MSTPKRAAKALSFAHLTGVGARAEENQDEDRVTKEDEEREDKAKKAKRAEEDDDEAKAEGDDLPSSDDGDEDDDGDSKGKKAKKAKAEQDDEEEEDEDREIEMRGNSAVAKARLREQARCAAIFSCRAAGRNPELAASLAFNTRMPRAEAVAVLEATPGNAAPNRAAGNPRVSPGMDAQPNSRQAISAGWDAAFARVNPQRRK